MNFLLGLVVDPHFYDGPNTSEQEWGVHNIHVSEYFGIIVLSHFGGRFHEFVCSIGIAQFDVFEIENGACLGNSSGVASLSLPLLGASFEDGGEEGFIEHGVVQ